MRCAIYTRVSTNSQVENDYNSLETKNRDRWLIFRLISTKHDTHMMFMRILVFLVLI